MIHDKYSNYKKLTLDLLDFMLETIQPRELDKIVIVDYEKHYNENDIQTILNKHNSKECKKVIFTNGRDIYDLLDSRTFTKSTGLILVRTLEHFNIYSRAFYNLSRKVSYILAATPFMEKTLEDIIIGNQEKQIQDVESITFTYLRSTYEIINELYDGWYRDGHKWFITRKSITSLPYWKRNEIIKEIILDGYPHLVTVHKDIVEDSNKLPGIYYKTNLKIEKIQRTQDIASYLYEKWYNAINSSKDKVLFVFPNHKSLIDIINKPVDDIQYMSTISILFSPESSYFATPSSLTIWLLQEGYYGIDKMFINGPYIITKAKIVK